MAVDMNSLAFDIASDIMRPAVSATPGVVGAAFPFSEDVALSVVKGLLDALATNFGGQFTDLVLTQRDRIRKVVGPIALKSLDELIHGLQD